ncbi:hypothetical protein B296_00057799 [Ensete ventricosum]|uniref:Uncharacterized protein n=1 Tax=Ensete ventricosum TaxID=4639 RepID=A0A426XPR6_ENSVE|nr:hypothetical protein B296_00057799 [Ensete ventricosum]
MYRCTNTRYADAYWCFSKEGKEGEEEGAMEEQRRKDGGGMKKKRAVEEEEEERRKGEATTTSKGSWQRQQRGNSRGSGNGSGIMKLQLLIQRQSDTGIPISHKPYTQGLLYHPKRHGFGSTYRSGCGPISGSPRFGQSALK